MHIYTYLSNRLQVLRCQSKELLFLAKGCFLSRSLEIQGCIALLKPGMSQALK